ncbi:MAG TPA: uracil-DNA glycosylase [Cycloclasticus sp.]|jgi:Uracil-DNA glycosylase|nr:uracil-DNA glycosylase [Cycloclasticus sp.]
MSSTANRLKYLDAIGVQVWEERVAPEQAIAEDFNAPIVTQNLDQLFTQAEVCTRCEASQSRKQIVFSDGSAKADWFIVGEFPSQQDELQGRPFTEEHGRLLGDMLKAIGVSKAATYQAVSVKCRTQNGEENDTGLIACRQYLLRQIALVSPSVILVLGEKSAQSLLDSKQTINELRGKVHALDGISSSVIISHSINHLMQSSASKKQTWQDLKLAKSAL